MLHVLELDEARKILLDQIRPIDRTLFVDVSESIGRVLSENIKACTEVPDFDRATVDGLAVRASDTFGASDAMPAILRHVGSVCMGQTASFVIGSGECASIPTGGAMPAGADAMVMVEYVEDLGDHLRLISRPSSPGDHLILRGDDLKPGQTVLKAGQVIRAADIGTLATLNLTRVRVCAKPRVAIISTGDELVTVGQPLAPGQIQDVNSPMLAGLIREAGGESVHYGIVIDQLERLDACLRQALTECDLVLVSGGSSVGEKDHLHAAIQAQGEPGILFHGIAVKPGKPTLAGVAKNRIILGLPGHPLAAWFMAYWLARPLIQALQRADVPFPNTISARTSCRIPSNAGRETIIPVRLVIDPEDQNLLLAEPIFSKSGLITQLNQSDGCIRISRDREGLEMRSPVIVYRF